MVSVVYFFYFLISVFFLSVSSVVNFFEALCLSLWLSLVRKLKMAEGTGFEPAVGKTPTPDFESGALNHSSHPSALIKLISPTYTISTRKYKKITNMERTGRT